jgi:hypothetical protein
MPYRLSTSVLVLSIVVSASLACRSKGSDDLGSRLYVSLWPTLRHRTPEPIRVFDADPSSGALSPSSVQIDVGDEFLIRAQIFRHPSERYLVLGHVGTFRILAKDDDGSLKLLPKERTVHSGAVHDGGKILQHPEKSFLYIFNPASYGNRAGMFALRVGDGETTPFFEMVRTAEEPGCDGMAAALSPDGKVLYCSSDFGKSILVVDVNDPAGPFARAATIPAANQVRELLVDPSGERLYVLTGDSPPSSVRWDTTWISAYRRTALSGRLTAVTRGVTTLNAWVSEMAITPDGRYLYALDRVLGQVLGFAVESEGSLRQIAGARAGTEPSVLAIQPAGRLVYVGNEGSEDIIILTIGPGGELVPVPGAALPIEGAPVSVSFGSSS